MDSLTSSIHVVRTRPALTLTLCSSILRLNAICLALRSYIHDLYYTACPTVTLSCLYGYVSCTCYDSLQMCTHTIARSVYCIFQSYRLSFFVNCRVPEFSGNVSAQLSFLSPPSSSSAAWRRRRWNCMSAGCRTSSSCGHAISALSSSIYMISPRHLNDTNIL